MKLEALRRRVVRLFRPAATSAPPKIEPITDPNDISGPTHPLDEIGNRVLKQLREAVDLTKSIRPPIDAGTNGWTWSQWSKEAAAGGVIPGWAFCRFANRLGEESVGFVFGHVRGGFGVWRQPFEVCTADDDGVDQRPEILTCITHLNSGMGVGIFADRDTAILAAELAGKVCPGWETEAPERLWSAYMDRTLSAWHGIGIRTSSNAHAHDSHGTRFHIYGQDNESVMAGKPERLS